MKKTQVLQENHNVLYAFVSVEPWHKWSLWCPPPTMNLKVACQGNRLDPPFFFWLGGTVPQRHYQITRLCVSSVQPNITVYGKVSDLEPPLKLLWNLVYIAWFHTCEFLAQPFGPNMLFASLWNLTKTCCLMLDIELASWLMCFKSWVFTLFFSLLFIVPSIFYKVKAVYTSWEEAVG